MARVYPREEIAPGGQGLARLALETPVVLRGADRFVIRRYSPVTTLGGGTVLDPSPPVRCPWPEALASEEPGPRLEALIARRPQGVATSELPVLSGSLPAGAATLAHTLERVVAVGDRWVLRERLDAAEARVVEQLDAYHKENPSAPGLSVETLRSTLRASAWLADHVVRHLEHGGRIAVRDGLAARADFTPRARGGEDEVNRVVEILLAAGLEPPSTTELADRLRLTDLAGALRIATSRGLIEAVERDRYFSREALDRFRATVLEVGKGGELVPAALRDRLGISRKYLIPLLEWCDRKGVTYRDPTGVRRLR
jgi:selenocysteine-specific elongation factor